MHAHNTTSPTLHEQQSGFKKEERDGDKLAEFVQVAFKDAERARNDLEQVWAEAKQADHAQYPQSIPSMLGFVKRQQLYTPLVRRKKEAAVVKLTSHLFEGGAVPVSVKTTKHLDPQSKQFYSLLDQAEDQREDAEALALQQQAPPNLQKPPQPEDDNDEGTIIDIQEDQEEAAQSLRRELQDIMSLTGFANELRDSLPELALYGTACIKAPILKKITSPKIKVEGLAGEEQKTSAQMVRHYPTIERVSIWDVYPSPGATKQEDLDYVIQYKWLSRLQFVRLAKVEGINIKALHECLEGEEMKLPNRARRLKESVNSNAGIQKGYELMEFWGDVSIKDLKEHIPTLVQNEEGQIESEDGESYTDSEMVAVSLLVCGNRVLRAVLNPREEERIPYYFAYWRRNPDSIFGDGIYWQLQDYQTLVNFLTGMLIDAKEMSSIPMIGLKTAALEDPTDLSIRKGKVWQFNSNSRISDAFQAIGIPDVSGNLLDIIQWLERQADLITGLSPVGMGESVKYQTQTATGLSLLDSNDRTRIANVVQGVNDMVTGSLQRISARIIEEGDDPSIIGDFEFRCAAYDGYINQVLQRNQIKALIADVSQIPQIAEQLDWEYITKILVQSHSFDPDLVLTSKEKRQERMQEAQQQEQEQQQAEQQQMMQELQRQKQERLEETRLRELQAIGEDERKARLEMRKSALDKGEVLNPVDFTDASPLLEVLGMQQQGQPMQQPPMQPMQQQGQPMPQ